MVCGLVERAFVHLPVFEWYVVPPSLPPPLPQHVRSSCQRYTYICVELCGECLCSGCCVIGLSSLCRAFTVRCGDSRNNLTILRGNRLTLVSSALGDLVENNAYVPRAYFYAAAPRVNGTLCALNLLHICLVGARAFVWHFVIRCAHISRDNVGRAHKYDGGKHEPKPRAQ